MKKRGPGRPKAKIDWKQIDEWLRKDVMAITIADRLGISVDTLYVRCKTDHNQDFSAYRQEKLAQGADSLKEHAYDQAIAGDKTMLIFLLKNRAGYSDHITSDVNHNIPDETAAKLNTLTNMILTGMAELKG